MGDVLDKAWGDAVGRFPCLKALIIATVDGATVRRLGDEAVSGPVVASVMAQASKLKLGKVASTTAFFETACVSVVEAKGLVFGFVMRGPANVGAVLALAPELTNLVVEVRRRVRD